MDLEAWAISMMERHNRKSHLVPQLSPSTKTFLRGDDKSSSPSSSTKSSDRTPTVGDIPISAIANGNGISSSRPAYPARTSSASQVPSYTSQSMNLPIRPAPPPNAPTPRTARRADAGTPTGGRPNSGRYDQDATRRPDLRTGYSNSSDSSRREGYYDRR